MYDDPTLEMADWEDFFAGTCFAGATLEDLKWLQESGYTMDQLIQIASDTNRSSVWQMLSGIALMAAYKDKTVSFGELQRQDISQPLVKEMHHFIRCLWGARKHSVQTVESICHHQQYCHMYRK